MAFICAFPFFALFDTIIAYNLFTFIRIFFLSIHTKCIHRHTDRKIENRTKQKWICPWLFDSLYLQNIKSIFSVTFHSFVSHFFFRVDATLTFRLFCIFHAYLDLPSIFFFILYVFSLSLSFSKITSKPFDFIWIHHSLNIYFESKAP